MIAVLINPVLSVSGLRFQFDPIAFFKHLLVLYPVQNPTSQPPMPPPVLTFYARPPQPMLRADGAGFNRDVRDAVNVIGGYSKLQEIAERVLHIKQLLDHRYIFPAGEEDLEQAWFESNVARLKQILDDIPVKLAAANFSDWQKMVMLERDHPNSIHLAIKDAVDQKGAGLYDFMCEFIDN